MWSTVGSVLLGLVNIAIVLALLILVGLVFVWILQLIAHIAVPQNIQQIYVVIVALIGLYMFVALIFGLPTVRVLPFRG